jgi:hypothetical protein
MLRQYDNEEIDTGGTQIEAERQDGHEAQQRLSPQPYQALLDLDPQFVWCYLSPGLKWRLDEEQRENGEQV